MYEYDDLYEQEPTELESGILSLVKHEFDNQVKSFKDSYEWHKENYAETKKQFYELKVEHEELKRQSSQIEEFEVFKGLIDENNFETILSHFNLKQTGIKIDGMDSERIPLWFKVLIKYYDDKSRLIALMDIFNIKYDKWIHSYKMPYEYNCEEVDVFIKDLPNRYIANGCNFDSNLGFFWESIRGAYGDSIKNMKANRSFSNYVPWQLFLKNPLLTTDEFFDKILAALKKKTNNSHYFFKIQDYQELTPEQAYSMFEHLPKKGLYDIHKDFIKNNKNIIKVKPELAAEFEDQINDNQYTSFYYLNFPLEMQIEFIKRHTSRYETKFDLVKKMEISKEDKIKLLGEIASELLVDGNPKK